MTAITDEKTTLADLALSFAPFGILLGGAIIAALAAPDVLYARTQYTFRLAILLATPALIVLIASFGRAPLPKLWRLWWTFAFLAMMVHIAFAFFGMLGGDAGGVVLIMGDVETILVVSVLVLWALDLLLAWTAPAATSAIIDAIRILAPIGLVASTLFATFNRTGLVYWLGIAVLALLTTTLILRLIAGRNLSMA